MIIISYIKVDILIFPFHTAEPLMNILTDSTIIKT